MRTQHAPASGQRPGFTLIEMLVVLGIILMLAVLTVLFMPRIQERQKVAKGAEQLQSRLLMAKMRALRDRVATGIRLQVVQRQQADRTVFYVRDLQYIQKPDDYSPSATYSPDYLFTGQLVNPNIQNYEYAFGSKVNLLGSAGGDPGDETSLVQRGDYLQLRGEGLLHRIEEVKGPRSCVLPTFPASPAEVPPYPPGCTFRIIRQPRLLPGEQPLQLPQDVGIVLFEKLNTGDTINKSINVPSRQTRPGGNVYVEVLFSPSGAVVGQGTGNSPIIFWLRDVTQEDVNKPGDETLIAIYPRTGLIAGHPVAPGADPYQFAKDGRSSGL